MKRKFIRFTDDELSRLADAIKAYGDQDLLKQVNDEIRERKRAQKQYEEWARNRPNFYCC